VKAKRDQEHRLDRVFAALSDPTRRGMLALLASSELTVAELAAPFDLAPPTISKHIRVLEDAGLVARRREGRHLKTRLDAAVLAESSMWLDRIRSIWDDRFAAIDQVLAARRRK
jgi:DNA-binding transcriptional ArsR family regulator